MTLKQLRHWMGAKFSESQAECFARRSKLMHSQLRREAGNFSWIIERMSSFKVDKAFDHFTPSP
jgi:hypothetical protein